MPSCLVIQHAAPERTYAIGAALEAAGVHVDVRRTYASDPLPASLRGGTDGLVVMGGPMSATSDEGFPTRRQEIHLLTEALRLGIPTLGVCLGAQLLATAAGGQAVPGRAGPEIGWAEIHVAPTASTDPLFATARESLSVLHWHGDTYRLPPAAVHLASSRQYAEQAFRVGKQAWGLQFHLEVDAVAVAEFTNAFGEDAILAGTTPAAIVAATPGALRTLAPCRDEILARFAKLIDTSAAPRVDSSVNQLANRT